MGPYLTLAVVFGAMIGEARLSRAHERVLRARGAREPADDVYRTMQWAYPACFAAMALEGLLRSRPGAAPSRSSGAPPGRAGRRRGGWRPPVVRAGAVGFGLAKALKYWAMSALGERWSFRVLHLPDAPLVASGPYRHLRHPNYLAVMLEIVSVALLLRAPLAGILSLLGFGALVRRRIDVEERALGLRR